MKAIIWTQYGGPDVLKLGEAPKPTPKDDEVLVRIIATTVTAGDVEMRNLNFPLFLSLPMRAYVGITKPQRVTVLGQELAGEIEAVGKDVTRFQVGDQVFATTGFNLGAYAEYKCFAENPDEGVLARKPANVSFAEAAAVPTAGMEALHFLRKAGIRPGEKLLIIGGGGSIGTFAVQLAKNEGAEVTAVDRGEKLAMLRALGADHVVDYTQEDFGKRETYDVVLDVVGRGTYSRAMQSLQPGGRYACANPRLSLLVRGRWASLTGDKQVILEMTQQKTEDLLHLKELIEAGKLKAVIDRSFPLAQMAEAHRYVETGRKQGNVVITVADSDQS